MNPDRLTHPLRCADTLVGAELVLQSAAAWEEES